MYYTPKRRYKPLLFIELVLTIIVRAKLRLGPSILNLIGKSTAKLQLNPDSRTNANYPLNLFLIASVNLYIYCLQVWYYVWLMIITNCLYA